ncbi:hypothetical protein Bca101_055554 [Brassica carinata]
MAGKKQQLPVSGEPLTDVESPMTYTITKKKKKSKKNKHSEKDEEVEVLQEVTDGEELSNKEKKKKKRKREEKEKEADKVAVKKSEPEDSSMSNGGESEKCGGSKVAGECLEALKDIKLAQFDLEFQPPGRLRDLTESNELMLSLWVLDEADRMLDMGFEEPVRFILSKTNKVRQTVLFSATWPMVDVHKLAQEFMELNPVKVVIGSVDLAAIHDVMQIVEVRSLSDITPREGTGFWYLPYTRWKLTVSSVVFRQEARKLYLHENKAQNERTRSCPLLVATDVAARGLDIPNVEVVINYSFPLTTEGYVHRIGRTGRAENTGTMETVSTNNQTLPVSSDETVKFVAYSSAVHKVIVMVNAGVIGLLQLINQQTSLLETHKAPFCSTPFFASVKP